MQSIIQQQDAPASRLQPSVPTSWNHGSFHANNPIYTSQASGKPPIIGYSRDDLDAAPIMNKSRGTQPSKSPGVYPEDIFRCMKENKQISTNYHKSFKNKHDMAMSRFESDINMAAQMPGGAANNLVAGNPGLGPLAKRLMMSPDIDEKEALSLIQLPAETMYLIDKVVRQKARVGPIGVDNSEVINLEFENEFKSKHKHIFKLNDGTVENAVAEDFAEGYMDENGVFHGLDQDQKLFQQNEKLLQRLTNAVYRENKGRPNADFAAAGMDENAADNTAHTDIINISASQPEESSATNAQVRDLISQQVNASEAGALKGTDLGGMGIGSSVAGARAGASQPSQILALEAKAKKKTHAEWVRRKQHELELRAKLIIEAKRDLLETLVQKQEEEAIRMQERTHQMSEWERRKRMHLQHNKLLRLQKDENERLEKKHRQEISYMKFKEWLKRSLIRQREEQVQKKMVRQEKKAKEEEEARTKANRRVMARIAYKDWRQTKMEEEKLRKKRELIQRRQGLFDSRTYGRAAKPGRTFSARGGLRSEASSRYINTDQKQNQMSTRGGQANMLAYSLNKNMKNLRMEEGNALMRKQRPKSAVQTRAPVAKRNKRAATNRGYGQGQAAKQMAQRPMPQYVNQNYNYPGAQHGYPQQDSSAYAMANNVPIPQPPQMQPYGNQMMDMAEYHQQQQQQVQPAYPSDQYYHQQQQQRREDLMQEAEDPGQMHGSRAQLQPQTVPPGAQAEQMGAHPQQELGQAMNLDRSPGGANMDPNAMYQETGQEEEEEGEEEQSMSASNAQQQQQQQQSRSDQSNQEDQVHLQEALALAADMNAEAGDDEGEDEDEDQDELDEEQLQQLQQQQLQQQQLQQQQDGVGQVEQDGDDEHEPEEMYQQMIANQMDQGEEVEAEGEEDMIYDDEDFDPDQIFAQIGLTNEQLQNLTEEDLQQLSEAQIQGIARLQMHQMQQEQRMEGAGEDDEDGLGDGGEDYPEMTEAEYMQLVAEQERLAREQQELDDDDDEEGLTEEQIEQLREAFDACDQDKDGALSKAELQSLLMAFGAQLNEETIEKLNQVADVQDGKIQFEEFVAALEGSL